MEIRRIIIEDVEKGISVKEIRRVLRVSPSAIYALLRRKRQTGRIEPGYQGKYGRPSKMTQEQLNAMEELVKQHPDLIQKKMIHACEQKRPDVVQQRKKWSKRESTFNSRKLVFLDESGLNINMTRLYGRAKRKERVHDYTPLNTPQTLTMLSSMRFDGTMVLRYFSGALTGGIFLDYIQGSLVLTLQKGDMVILDNLRCHKVSGVREAIEAASASVVYLSPYSPDFHPIEMLWSKLKTIFRALKIRSFDLLCSAIPLCLDAVCLSDIEGWFREAGYSVS